MSTLKTYRQARQITQSEMANLLDVKQATISRIENGDTPSLPLAVRIELVTGGEVKATSLVGESTKGAA